MDQNVLNYNYVFATENLRIFTNSILHSNEPLHLFSMLLCRQELYEYIHMHSTTLKKLGKLKDGQTAHELHLRFIGFTTEGRRPAEDGDSIPCSPSRPSPRTVVDRTRAP